MAWEKPSFVVIEMNAEIGGYQADFDGDEPEHVEATTQAAVTPEPQQTED